MKTKRIRAALSFVSHLVILVSTVLCVVGLLGAFHLEGDAVHMEIFRYYTTLSNVLGGLVGIPMAVLSLRRMRGKKAVTPRWLGVVRFVSASALTLTMMTVLCFLGPLFGYGSMFRGANFWFHLINPLLSILSFILFEEGASVPRRNPFPGIVQTVLYGAVYVPMVLSGGWPDFYGFNIGGRWYLSLIAMLAANLLLARLLLLGREIVCQRIGAGDKTE